MNARPRSTGPRALKQEAISVSEGEKAKRVNEAEGRAAEIELVARATAEGLRQVAESVAGPGGYDAANLRIAEKYLAEFGNMAKQSNTMIVPGNMSDLSGMIATATSVFKKANQA